MSVKIIDNFDLKSNIPLDPRDYYIARDDMAAVRKDEIENGHIAFCEGSGTYKKFNNQKIKDEWGYWEDFFFDGNPVIWKGEHRVHPENPKENWCYRNTVDRVVYIFDGSQWKIMVKDGYEGSDGLSVYVTYHDNSANNRPNRPTGDGTSDGWHHDLTIASIWKSEKNARSIEEGEWGDPVRIVGIDGSAGKGRNVMAYTSTTALSDAPATPVGGHIDTSTWEITYPTGPDGHKWGDSNELDGFVWVSNCDFDNDGNPIEHTDSQGNKYTWSVPFCITGKTGDAGADGVSVEFIYLRLPERSDFDDYAMSAEMMEVKNQREYTRDGVHHTYQENDYVPYNTRWKYNSWSDHPTGISDSMRLEICLSRKKVDQDGQSVWGPWGGPVIWASWGEDGIDGDGIEYIFAVTQRYEKPSNLPKSTDVELAPHWQHPEIWDCIRELGLTSRYAPWTDDPKDVGPNEPYEWVSIRRKKWVEDENKSWFGEFETPVLWAKWSSEGPPGSDGHDGKDGRDGIDGDTYEYIYARTNAIPDSVSVENPESQTEPYHPNMLFVRDGVTNRVGTVGEPMGVSADHLYEYMSVRRKHNGVWGAYSVPSLRANYVQAALTPEELEAIKNSVREAIKQDIATLEKDISDLKARGVEVDTWITQTDTTISLHGASIQEHGTALVGVGQEIDAVKGTVSSHASKFNTIDSDLTNVHQSLNAVDGKIESSVAKAEIFNDGGNPAYLIDRNSNPLYYVGSGSSKRAIYSKNNYYYTDEDYNTPYRGSETPKRATLANDYGIGVPNVKALSYIGQKAGEVDITAITGAQAAALVVKATNDSSWVNISADHINLNGDTSATRATIGKATITDASITNGTITSANINGCTINSILKSKDFSSGQPGFYFDSQSKEFEINDANGSQITPSLVRVKKGEFNECKVVGSVTAGGRIDGAEITGGSLGIGYNDSTQNYNFKVQKSGSMYAKDAELEGNLTIDSSHQIKMLGVNGAEKFTLATQELKLDNDYETIRVNTLSYIARSAGFYDGGTGRGYPGEQDEDGGTNVILCSIQKSSSDLFIQYPTVTVTLSAGCWPGWYSGSATASGTLSLVVNGSTVKSVDASVDSQSGSRTISINCSQFLTSSTSGTIQIKFTGSCYAVAQAADQHTQSTSAESKITISANGAFTIQKQTTTDSYFRVGTNGIQLKFPGGSNLSFIQNSDGKITFKAEILKNGKVYGFMADADSGAQISNGDGYKKPVLN